jgi:hypothetical protein
MKKLTGAETPDRAATVKAGRFTGKPDMMMRGQAPRLLTRAVMSAPANDSAASDL